jgi:hypothetical protein
MLIEPEISAASIVVLGKFSPQLFHPSWFAKHGLVPEEAAENADIGVIHPQLASFGMESFFLLNIDEERFAIERSVAPLVVVCDIVTRLFGELLPYHPIRALGINRVVHFDVGSAAKRERIGEMLASRAPWGEWGKALSSGEGNKHGGMLSLTMIQRDLADREAGHVLARIEPSARIGSQKSGIYMEINDHYQFAPEQDGEAIAKLLAERFDSSLSKADAIINQIMTLS